MKCTYCGKQHNNGSRCLGCGSPALEFKMDDDWTDDYDTHYEKAYSPIGDFSLCLSMIIFWVLFLWGAWTAVVNITNVVHP